MVRDFDVKHALGTDFGLVAFFSDIFFEGWEPSKGEHTLAAVMANLPRFRTAGDLTLPRAKRALVGWRRLSPQRSRTPHAIFVVAGLAALLVKEGELAMAVFVIMAFETYARPGNLMALRRSWLLAPLASVGPCWRFLLHPSRHNEQSKAGTQGDTLLWDVREFTWLDKLFPTLKAGAPVSKLWLFHYYGLCKQIKKAAGKMHISFVPYQLRHRARAGTW